MGKQKNNNSQRLLAGPPKIRKTKKPKTLGKTKTQKNNSGEVLRKRGSRQESLRIVFLFFVFSDLGGSSQESLRIVFFRFSQDFCVLASELTSHLKASVLFAYI